MKTKKLKWLILIPGILLAIISIYPMLWTLCGSVNTESQLGRVSVIPEGVTLQNFITVFTQYDFPRYIGNTLLFAIAAMLLSLPVNGLAAYSLSRLRFPGRNVLFVLVLMTMMIPFSVTMIPLFVVVRDMGLLNSLGALILPSIAGGFGIFMMRQFFMNIPRDLEDAAKIDGLSYLGIFFHIIVPLSKPIFLSLGLFSFLSCWNSYLWPLIANNEETYWVLSTGIASFAADRNTDWNMILTGATVSMIPTGIMFAFFQKQLVDGVKMSGLKL